MIMGRLIRDWNKQKNAQFEEQWSQLLIEYALEDEEDSKPLAEIRSFLKESGKSWIHAKRSKRVLQGILLNLHENLKGTAAEKLRELYFKIQLNLWTSKQLRSRSTVGKIKAIRALTKMGAKEQFALIERIDHRGNQSLQTELLIAKLVLSEQPFGFLSDAKTSISKWTQMRLHAELVKLDALALPLFSQWLDNDESSVLRFCLDMCAAFDQQFRDDNAIRKAKQLIRHENVGVQIAAIGVLSKWGEESTADLLLARYKEVNEERLQIALLRGLGNAIHEGVLEVCISLLLNIPQEAHLVRVAAVKSLAQLYPQGIERLSELNEEHKEDDPMLEQIITQVLNAT